MWRYAGMMIAGWLIALVPVAFADVAPTPYNFITVTRCSSTVATGGTSQTAVPANKGIKAWWIQNPSTATDSIFLDFTGAAVSTAGTSVELEPGQMLSFGGPVIWNNGVTVNAATTGDKYVCFYAQ